MHLERAGYNVLNDLDGSFSDGWALARLINTLFDVPIPKLLHSPKMRVHKLDNLDQVFKMLESAKVMTHFLKVHHCYRFWKRIPSNFNINSPITSSMRNIVP